MADEGRIVLKQWGKEVWISNSDFYCGKKLIVNPGYRCSLHRHLVKNEAFFVEQGYGWALVAGEPIELIPGAVVEVAAGSWHMFWCSRDGQPLVLLEISSHHSDEDVERWEGLESRKLVEPPTVPLEELEG